MKIFLTGGTGYIGRALYGFLKEQNYTLGCAFRKNNNDVAAPQFPNCSSFFIEKLDGHTIWNDALKGIDVVIHLAGMANMAPTTDSNLHQEYQTVNFDGTRHLAVQAAQNGVKRFVFLSSIGVNGRESREPFLENDIEAPHDAYTISKFRAENALRKIEAETDMEVVILRPPPIYGPDAKESFVRLFNWVSKGVPLPFAGITNKRSFMALENLIDVICLCINHPKAGGRTFLVSDGHAISTEELIGKIAHAMGRKPMLFHIPKVMMRWSLSLLGRQRIYERLWGDLSVDSTLIQKELGWTPRVSADQALKQAVRGYIRSHK